MGDAKLVSIIMPAYNCEKYVGKAIESILNQTYTNFELLIADDCSRDGTKRTIEKFLDPRIKTFHNEVNLGYLQASNKLFKLCKGEYITFQDADDYSDSERIMKLIEFLELNPKIDCVGSNVVKISAEGKEFARSNFPLADADIRKAFLNYRIVVTGSALMLKKDIIEEIGIYNEFFDRIGSEDIYMFSHILGQFNVANLSDPLYYYRANPTSVSSSHENPKALVGHNIVIFFYKRRLRKQSDFILKNEWEKANKCMDYFGALYLINKAPFKGVLKFIMCSLKHPRYLPYFIKNFYRILFF